MTKQPHASQPSSATQLLLQKGFKALSRGDLVEAGESARQILVKEPNLVQGHFLVGLLSLESRDRKTAFSAFQSVVKLNPDHAAAWAQLAKLYMTEGQVTLADAALRETRRIKPEEPIVLDLIGNTLSLMGEHATAKAFYARANTKQPNHPPFMQNLANNLVFHGDMETADAIFRDIIRITPNSPQAHWGLSGSQKAESTAHIEEMQRHLNDCEKSPRAQAFYFYAIGKEYEDLQQWDKAFDAFSAGATARRSTVEYDESAEIEMFEFLQERYTSEWLDTLADGDANEKPIFVLGQPRTGTTLIERIITSHSQVHSAGELQQFGLAMRRLSRYQNPKRYTSELFAKAQALEPVKIGRMYLQTTEKMQGGAARFVDKLPQNYLMIPLILKALPNAKIVHVVRDPMDACFASFKQLFADAYLHSYDQEEMARHHVRYYRLMETWRTRFPGRFIDVRYEDTARDLEPNARQLIDFLQLDWEDACLDFHNQATAVSTASAAQVREPAHTRSVGRWRRYEQQLQPMLKVLQSEDIIVS